MIELYDQKIDRATFKGNKVYVGAYLCLYLVFSLADFTFFSSAGGNLSIADFANAMYPHPVDQANYHYPQDGLLQAHGVVQDDEMRNLQHLDVHGDKCLFVTKDGSTTGTTVGRTNGLESFTRSTYTCDDHEEYGRSIKQETSIEIAVLPCDTTTRVGAGRFSGPGDSGSIVLARDGRIVGILTGGAGPRTEKKEVDMISPTSPRIGGSRRRSRLSTLTIFLIRSSSSGMYVCRERARRAADFFLFFSFFSADLPSCFRYYVDCRCRAPVQCQVSTITR